MGTIKLLRRTASMAKMMITIQFYQIDPHRVGLGSSQSTEFSQSSEILHSQRVGQGMNIGKQVQLKEQKSSLRRCHDWNIIR